ncbi:ABC-2 transporter permease [Brevibacillus daliensis]|uniref:ABC-2 transporter permease n=1 Tax=Brevibacillus daliensis TaxID=2892995 RepID=UPI001E3D2014|nr:ABC-2 transporter permease [Brevibacillus daliensis]
MKGLLIKDILNLRKTFRTTLFILVFYGLLAYSMVDPSFLSGMVVLLFTMVSITSFSYDDLAKWDTFALSMPVTKKEMVVSKYLLSILLAVMGTLFSVVFGALMVLFKDTSSISEQLLVSYVLFGIAILFVCIMLPLVYKFGVERSRVMMIAIFAIPTFIAFVLNRFGVPMPTEEQFFLLVKLSPLFLVLCIVLSYLISYKIYRNKDM